LVTVDAAPSVSAETVWAAASTAVARHLDGPARVGTVVAIFSEAVVLEVSEQPGGGLLVLVTARAVRLPCSVVVGELPPARVGDQVSAGAGRLLLGDTAVRVGRWWEPARPDLRDPAVAALRARRLPIGSAEGLGGAVAALLSAAHHDDRSLCWLAPRLLGLGPGSTPSGDDVLCGALVTLAAARDHGHELLADAIGAAGVTSRTTRLSGVLLGHAARGECIPELATLLAALDGRADLPTALRAITRVGHTSGPALVEGARLALLTRGHFT